MADFDYESLLDRARENIPRGNLLVLVGDSAPQIMIEGSNTIFEISTRSFQ